MNEWLLLLVASTVGSLFSLVGGILLLNRRLSTSFVQRMALPFAAGALLAAAFLDLLPEALDQSVHSAFVVMGQVLGGFIVFFILERFLGWFHHHHDHHELEHAARQEGRQQSTRLLIIIGDILHNSIDGMVIGAAFLADPVVGVITTIAIAAHEVPKEIGNFGVLLSLGMRRRNVLFFNLLAAFATVVAALLIFGVGGALTAFEPALLALAAGMFIYIAASDLVPTIHEETRMKVANYQTLVLIFGVVFVGATMFVVRRVFGIS